MAKKDLSITQELNMDELVKTIPVICSWCNKIYHLKEWQVDKGKQTGASHGMCPDCEKKQLDELEKLNELKKQAKKKDKNEISVSKMQTFKKTKELNIDQMSKTIPIVCSWCNKVYHLKEWQVDKGIRTGVSHGMCPECEQKQTDELRKLQNNK